MSMIGAAIANLFAWLSKRDQMKYDAEMNELRISNAHCHEEHDRAKEHIADLNGRVETLTEHVADCNEKHQQAEIRLARLEGKSGGGGE